MVVVLLNNAPVARGRGGTEAGPLHLGLEVGLTGEFGMPDYLPVLKILVEGHEVLAGPNGPARDRYSGSPPSALLDEALLLLPGTSPRRVVLYICGCGVPGDRCIVPVISGSGTAVRWTDFRQCWDSGPDFDPPVLKLDPETSAPIDIPDLLFDVRDRGTTRRRGAGLGVRPVADRAAARRVPAPWPPVVRGRGLVPRVGRAGWRQHQPVPDHAARRLRPHRRGGGPDCQARHLREQRARSMADYLMATPTRSWPVIRRIQNSS